MWLPLSLALLATAAPPELAAKASGQLQLDPAIELPSEPPLAPGLPEASATPAPAPGLHALVGRTRLTADGARYVYLSGAAADPAPLTLLPRLQQPLQRLIDSYQAPLAQLVAVDPSTGKVLAAIESQGQGAARDGVAAGDLAEIGLFPAASVFKIVTASALLSRGVDPDEEICFHGGKHRLRSRELDDDDRRDRRCATLAEAVAQSANVAIAKFAGRNLDPVWLRALASDFFFNRPVASDWPVPISPASIPADPFGFAAAAAGFGEVRLSPLHGAALAAAVANGGVMPKLTVFADSASPTAGGERVLSPELAAQLTEMLRGTVQRGTAHRAFRFRGAKGVDAAGKTGSLSDRKPFRDYSWFVGFAPASAPRIAVAALVVNGARWKVHASALAAAAFRTFLGGAKKNAGR